MNETKLSVQDIECVKIVELIEIYQEKINSFIVKMNKHLPSHFQVRTEDMIFDITPKEGYAFLDDGNTRTEGIQYNVTWSFPFFKDAKYRIWDVKNGYSYGCISFEFEATERVYDHSYRGSHFFSAKLSKLPKGELEYDVERFILENNNHKPGVKFTDLCLARIIKEVRAMEELYSILLEIHSDVSELD